MGAGAFSNQDFQLQRRRDRKVIWIRSTTGDSYRVPLDKAQYDVMTDVNADEPGGNVVWYIQPNQILNKPATYLSALDKAYVTDSDQYEAIPGTTFSAGIFDGKYPPNGHPRMQRFLAWHLARPCSM